MNAENGPSGQKQVSGKGLQGCRSTYCPDKSTNQLIDSRPNLQRDENSNEISMKMTRIRRNERVPKEKPQKEVEVLVKNPDSSESATVDLKNSTASIRIRMTRRVLRCGRAKREGHDRGLMNWQELGRS